MARPRARHAPGDSGALAASTRDARVKAASQARRARRRQQLRESIMTAAQELLGEGGAEAVTMRAIAERIGYSATTIYLHFEDRDALLFALLDGAFAEFRAALGTAAEGAEGAEAGIRAMGRAYVRFALEHPAQYRLMFVQRPDYLLAHGPEETGARIESLGALAALAGESPAGRAGRSDGTLAADVLWATVHGIAALATGVAMFDRARAERATDEALELLIKGLWAAE
jgi:AcrR family transcriptional regulator